MFVVKYATGPFRSLAHSDFETNESLASCNNLLVVGFCLEVTQE